MTFYPASKGKKGKDTKASKRYFVLETYNETDYRLLTPWNIFPSFQSPTKFIPDSWLPGVEDTGSRNKLYPSARVATYNQIIEQVIMKNHNEEVEEIPIESRDVGKEQGYLADKASTWFNAKTKSRNPKNIGEYRELVNGDDFRMFMEQQLVDMLKEQYELSKSKPKNQKEKEILISIMATSSSIARRISREMLGITTKTNVIRNMYETYQDTRLLTELQLIFKEHIRQAADVVMSYQSMCSALDKKVFIVSQ